MLASMHHFCKSLNKKAFCARRSCDSMTCVALPMPGPTSWTLTRMAAAPSGCERTIKARGRSVTPRRASVPFSSRFRSTCCSWMRSPSTGGSAAAKSVCGATPWWRSSLSARAMTSVMTSLIASRAEVALHELAAEMEGGRIDDLDMAQRVQGLEHPRQDHHSEHDPQHPGHDEQPACFGPDHDRLCDQACRSSALCLIQCHPSPGTARSRTAATRGAAAPPPPRR
jgi:hypothetical protein